MRKLSARLAAMLIAGLVAALPAAAPALSLIRDAETERTLRQMAAPLVKAAGMRAGSVDLYIVRSSQLNAFVAGGANMFLHTGLIDELEEPGQLMGVMAHEIGHIAGGHQVRRAINIRNAQGPALIAMLAGIAAAAAGGPQAGAAISAGATQALERSFLSYNRGEEASADQAALAYLERAGIDPAGFLEVLERFRGQEVFTVGNIDPYALTHPLSTQRMQLIEQKAAEARGRSFREDPEIAYWYGRARAKLEGFLDSPRRVLNRYEERDDELALYAKTVALHRLPAPREAVESADRLIAMRPGDPFYLELKGQILHESGRAREAVPLYRAAVAAAPEEPLLKAGLGRALLALEEPAADAEALRVLKEARDRDRGDPAALRDLAVAYSRAGDTGMATLATAERFALSGRSKDAVLHARRASALLPNGSPGWLRAQDILVLDKRDD
ncbi:M48 family metalloprotease [Paralimibaculum aggregatum]|uniref:M48 family metalloprotease n=1 Tax=Paralimibaculum aggregatum TaxID=3036245 RepID=A0ABQ6LPI1_9RHOB|nr:M48 family metalloprotease [Limibaculum sp. NKW23]GMG84446.1 M48 family metalloprotease [Limibaculum sp. NKW23]